MAAPSALYPFVRPDVQGCPTPMLEQSVMKAFRQFCEIGYAWRDYLSPLAPTEGAPEVALPPPSGARIIKVLSIDTPDGTILPKTMAEIQRLLPGWQSAEGVPAWFNSPEDPGVVRLYPIPRNLPPGFQLTARVVLSPTLASTTIPDGMVERHHEAIAHGAKAVLMSMKDKTWTDMALATAHGTTFRIKCDEERARLIHEHTNASLRVQPRRFG